jgi:hypothetical protein
MNKSSSITALFLVSVSEELYSYASFVGMS